MKQNVFQYAATCEANFEANLENVGNYKRKTTFYSDLSIAEFFSKNDVLDTYKRVMREWIKDIEYITEFVLCLNYKSWEWHYKNNQDMVNLYVSLYEKASADVVENYKNNEKALKYYYKTLN